MSVASSGALAIKILSSSRNRRRKEDNEDIAIKFDEKTEDDDLADAERLCRSRRPRPSLLRRMSETVVNTVSEKYS